MSAFLERQWDDTHPARLKMAHLTVYFEWQDLSGGGNPPVRTTAISQF
jgi:hypothetical protein